jgi:integrase
VLTEPQCRSARPREKAYKLADSKGLYLFVSGTGYRSWRWKYRFAGKEKRLVFGPYPEVGLKQARDLRDDGRQLLRQGIDPGARRREAATAAAIAGETVEKVGRRWHAAQAALWKSKHAADVLHSLAEWVFPARSAAWLWEGRFGELPIAAVRPRHVRAVLKAIEDRGAIETAHRVRGRLSAVFAMAIAEELAESDPAGAVAKALQPVRKGRMPALETLHQARAFLRDIEAMPAHPVTKLASRLLALTVVRPGVIRFTPREAEFTGLGGKAPLWTVPAARMKLELAESEDPAFDFLVPLSAQAADVVRVAQRLAGGSLWLFPQVRFPRRPISENALSYAYKRLTEWRGRHVPHGWRSTFSTIMNELAAVRDRPGDRQVIDLMLAHAQAGVEPIYNRAAYMPRRREIAQEWADMLLEGFPPAEALLEGPRR